MLRCACRDNNRMLPGTEFCVTLGNSRRSWVRTLPVSEICVSDVSRI
uniref:Uncharacterized protein n=1 Tax=Arundo donax TaxID=35708 RepID=A0A0A9TPY4_ARUDO